MSSCSGESKTYCGQIDEVRKQNEVKQFHLFSSNVYNLRNLLNCSICLDLYNCPVELSTCKHIFCKNCLDTYFEYTDKEKVVCPICYKAIVTQTISDHVLFGKVALLVKSALEQIYSLFGPDCKKYPSYTRIYEVWDNKKNFLKHILPLENMINLSTVPDYYTIVQTKKNIAHVNEKYSSSTKEKVDPFNVLVKKPVQNPFFKKSARESPNTYKKKCCGNKETSAMTIQKFEKVKNREKIIQWLEGISNKFQVTQVSQQQMEIPDFEMSSASQNYIIESDVFKELDKKLNNKHTIPHIAQNNYKKKVIQCSRSLENSNKPLIPDNNLKDHSLGGDNVQGEFFMEQVSSDDDFISPNKSKKGIFRNFMENKCVSAIDKAVLPKKDINDDVQNENTSVPTNNSKEWKRIRQVDKEIEIKVYKVNRLDKRPQKPTVCRRSKRMKKKSNLQSTLLDNKAVSIDKNMPNCSKICDAEKNKSKQTTTPMKSERDMQQHTHVNNVLSNILTQFKKSDIQFKKQDEKRGHENQLNKNKNNSFKTMVKTETVTEENVINNPIQILETGETIREPSYRFARIDEATENQINEQPSLQVTESIAKENIIKDSLQPIEILQTYRKNTIINDISQTIGITESVGQKSVIEDPLQNLKIPLLVTEKNVKNNLLKGLEIIQTDRAQRVINETSSLFTRTKLNLMETESYRQEDENVKSSSQMNKIKEIEIKVYKVNRLDKRPQKPTVCRRSKRMKKKSNLQSTLLDNKAVSIDKNMPNCSKICDAEKNKSKQTTTPMKSERDMQQHTHVNNVLSNILTQFKKSDIQFKKQDEKRGHENQLNKNKNNSFKTMVKTETVTEENVINNPIQILETGETIREPSYRFARIDEATENQINEQPSLQVTESIAKENIIKDSLQPIEILQTYRKNTIINDISQTIGITESVGQKSVIEDPLQNLKIPLLVTEKNVKDIHLSEEDTEVMSITNSMLEVVSQNACTENNKVYNNLNITPTCEEDLFSSDQDVIETTPERNRPSAIMAFSKLSNADDNLTSNLNTLFENDCKMEGVQMEEHFITSTPFQTVSRVLPHEFFNLSPIAKSSRQVLTIQNAKKLPLSFLPAKIETHSKTSVLNTSTSKQNNILNYFKPHNNINSSFNKSYSSQTQFTKKKPPVISSSRLSTEESSSLKLLSNKEIVSFENTFSSSVTHLIVGVDCFNCLKAPTLKYITAVAAGIWVLNIKWVQACLKRNRLVPEESFEVLDSSAVCGPQRSRLHRSMNPLFNDNLTSNLNTLFENDCKMEGVQMEEHFITSTPFQTVSRVLPHEFFNLSPIAKSSRQVLTIQNAKKLPLSFLPAKIETHSKTSVLNTSTSKQNNILNYFKPHNNINSSFNKSYSSQTQFTKKKPPVISSSRLSTEESSSLKLLSNKEIVSFENTFSSSVTHLIVGVDCFNCLKAPTLKYITAVAAGIWVLNIKWVQACLKRNRLVPEESFEVLDSSAVCGPQRSRLHRSMNPLFSKYVIYVTHKIKSISRKEVEKIILLLGGQVVPTPNHLLHTDDQICLIISENSDPDAENLYKLWLKTLKVVTVDLDWLVHSTGQYEVLSLTCYSMCGEESLGQLPYPDHLLKVASQSFIPTS
ncbi:hypothetical protein FQA39_LY09490 [Lamprigera yunnana]|nr:hypothetical protein FQA39_LY09490 [Lamprigera yunnana]